MFQTALTLRDRFVTGRTPPPLGTGSAKPSTPCLYARLPVAMDVHSIGERTGWSVAGLAIAPWFTIRSSVGSAPASLSGWITFQSAASQPISRTLGASRRAILANADN